MSARSPDGRDGNPDHRYRSAGQDPRELRPQSANRIAAVLLILALGLIAAIIIIVMLLRPVS